MEKFNLFLSLLSGAIALISLCFSFITYKRTVDHDRKQATLDAFNVLQEQALDKLSSYSHEQIAEIIKDHSSEEYKILSRYIARIEHFCVGVNNGIYDNTIVYELAHGFLDGSIKSRITPVLEHKVFNEGKEDFYSNTKKVFEWMNRETKRRKGA